MGFDRIAQMILRRLMRRAVTKGLDLGINALARRSSGGSGGVRATETSSAEEAERARIRAVRQERRARRSARQNG